MRLYIMDPLNHLYLDFGRLNANESEGNVRKMRTRAILSNSLGQVNVRKMFDFFHFHLQMGPNELEQMFNFSQKCCKNV